jgi:hypothetical protein
VRQTCCTREACSPQSAMILEEQFGAGRFELEVSLLVEQQQVDAA